MAAKRTLVSVSWSVQRADHGEQPYWMAVTLAAMLGEIGLAGRGIGFGLWWADAVAAIIISLNIMKDGFKRTKDSITDIIEQIPTIKPKSHDPFIPCWGCCATGRLSRPTRQRIAQARGEEARILQCSIRHDLVDADIGLFFRR